MPLKYWMRKEDSLPIYFYKRFRQTHPRIQKICVYYSFLLPQKPELALQITGHTDTVGRNEINIPLFARRAEAVKQYMVSNGIDPSRLTTSGEGAMHLLLRDRPTALENRRVEFVKQ